METQARKDVHKEDCWNVEAFYPTFTEWEEEFGQFNHDRPPPIWPKLAEFRGRLGESAEVLKEALDCLFAITRQAEKLYTYAHLRHDEDIAQEKHKVGNDKAVSLLYRLQAESSWFEPEILALSEDQLANYFKAEELEPYHFHLEKIIRMKKHTLNPEQEALLAQAGHALQTAQKAFSAINNADFRFGSVVDEKGKERPLTHASYGLYQHGPDRTLRKNAFHKMLGTFQEYENTLCELFNGQMQSHLFEAKARHYPNCVEAALYPHQVDRSVYDNLIASIHGEIHALHHYVEKRKELLGVDALYPYDLNAPLTREVDLQMPYDEAEALVIDSVAPLGEEYQRLLKEGLSEKRWVDRFENKNKRSGAYSSGTYDSMPYILMNYKGIVRDVFILAHEAGHSMHSLLSNQNQPFHYSHYPIFLAEVASTFNEELLFDLLIERTKDATEKRRLIAHKIQDIHSTFFRQVLFAEFELFTHQLAEKGQPLTPSLLKEKMLDLYTTYYGPALTLDNAIASEWSRIPHFYFNFYVYQYATGISAAFALHEKVTQGTEADRNAYLELLKSGSTAPPLTLLQQAGVDMHTAEPIKATIRKFTGLVDQL